MVSTRRINLFQWTSMSLLVLVCNFLIYKWLPYWIRTNVVGFADLHLNHSDNGSYIYILRKMRDSNSHNISVTSDFKSGPLPFRQSSNHIFIYSCGSRRIRTFGTFRFGTLAVCWFKPLTHTSIQGIWYFNCCSLLQLISYSNDMIQQ